MPAVYHNAEGDSEVTPFGVELKPLPVTSAHLRVSAGLGPVKCYNTDSKAGASN